MLSGLYFQMAVRSIWLHWFQHKSELLQYTQMLNAVSESLDQSWWQLRLYQRQPKSLFLWAPNFWIHANWCLLHLFSLLTLSNFVSVTGFLCYRPLWHLLVFQDLSHFSCAYTRIIKILSFWDEAVIECTNGCNMVVWKKMVIYWKTGRKMVTDVTACTD